MNKTAINWTDLTWNPWSGCKAVSSGCTYCYAEKLAEQKRGTKAFPNGFEVTFRPHKLSEPRRTKVPSLIFTNSMTDMFLEEVPDARRDEAFEAMAEAPQHRYQVLTKRPQEAARYFAGRRVPEHVWLGVTVENNAARHRIDTLRSIACAVRFLSCEPLTGHLDLRGRLDGIAWVIGGGESGTHYREAPERFMVRPGAHGQARWMVRADRYHWATDMRDACVEQGAAFWWKQWGGPTPKSGGRIVDGQQHNGMPTQIPGAMPSGWRLVLGPSPQPSLPLIS